MGRHRSAELVYLVALDRDLADAVATEVSGADIRRFHSVEDVARHRSGRCPRAVLFSLDAADVQVTLAALRAACGRQALFVGLEPRFPHATVWRHGSLGEVVEVGPGFLSPFLLPELRDTAPRSTRGRPGRSAVMGETLHVATLETSDAPERRQRAEGDGSLREGLSRTSGDPRDSLDEAFATLGLTARADLELVEKAYWHQADRCRSLLDERERRLKMLALNDARTLLTAQELERDGRPMGERPGRTSGRGGSAILPVALGSVAALAGGSVAYARSSDWRDVAIASALAALAAAGARGVGARVARRRAERRRVAPTPFETLCLTSGADGALVALAYRYLRARAMRDSAVERVRSVDRAYAQLKDSVTVQTDATSA